MSDAVRQRVDAKVEFKRTAFPWNEEQRKALQRHSQGKEAIPVKGEDGEITWRLGPGASGSMAFAMAGFAPPGTQDLRVQDPLPHGSGSKPEAREAGAGRS
mmetsp:Transcript_62135/g.148199  ORF Transcript_62135/g.148199 Transcript_62135/m.148199 type:complete len:101 (-) Transcript_62135:147-449(-)